MFILDVPDVPPQLPSVVMVAQVNQSQQPAKKAGRTIGVCKLVDNETRRSADGEIYPNNTFMNAAFSAISYFQKYEHRNDFTAEDIASAKVTLLQQTKHGELTEEEKPNFGNDYKYTPDAGYVGKDFAAALVEIKGLKIKVFYYFHVINGSTQSLWDVYCGKKGGQWKISLPGTLLDTPTLQSMLSFTGINSEVKFEIDNLSSGALGATQGTTITLDATAAGHNWFIDYTPYLNEEYLPTADPNVWKAKPGSKAEGKMDMLSVLLHEYGHVLGIEHSADRHASMAATLQPGVRRLPTADELALMAQLVGEVKSSNLTGMPENPQSPTVPLGSALGGFWLGRMRKSGSGVPGATSAASTDATPPQYAVAAHATLTNPAFTGGAGWSTAGTVTFDSGAATLTESATAQTRLNQLFVLGTQDRFLRFTLDNIALDDVNGAPDDAFEVALIDANTGLSLLGGTGLTRSDALLNLQADGTERIAPQAGRCITE